MSNPIEFFANGMANIILSVLLWIMLRIMFWLAGYRLSLSIEPLKQEDEA